MRSLLLAALLAAAPAMSGELVIKDSGGNQLRLYDTPCSHGETLGILKEEWRPKFKNARILNGKGHIQMYGCWIQQDEDAIVILSDGATLGFPLAVFSDPTI